ncbi:MAG: hypothetical protein Q7U34_07060 [Anaerolineales bacterium]|nr:hypothetical protein [Anaerolineales bacterium]
MTEVTKVQPKCYYTTPEYASSFWGKYIYIYKGQGRLQLTSESLVFESKSLSFDIPHRAISSISAGLFSRWAKPFGLTYISLQYLQDGKDKTIFLIPAESVFAPTWKTSKVIEDWIAALGQVGELSNRIKLPLPKVKPPTFAQMALFVLLLLAFSFTVYFIALQLLR